MRPGRRSGLALLALLAACDGGYDRSEFKTPTDPGSQFLVLSAEGETLLPADGASQLRIVARISPDATSRDIDFSTSAGTLTGGTGTSGTLRTVTADSSGRAEVVLQSASTPGTAVVTAQVKGVFQVAQSLSVAFDRALPDRLLLGLDKLTVMDSADDQITVTATLLRERGMVTAGTEVTFTATRDDTGGRFGIFNPSAAVTASDGTATVRFSPADRGFTGRATVTARAPNGRTASASFQVVAVTP